jgi:hypothetical protein
MKITLFTFSFVFLFWGCGQEEQPVVPKPPEKKPLASVDLAKLQLRGDLLYLQNTEVPFSGEAKSYYVDGQLRADALIQKGELKSLKRRWPNGASELEMEFGQGPPLFLQPQSYEASASFVLIPPPAIQNLKSVERDSQLTALLSKHLRGLNSAELRAKVLLLLNQSEAKSELSAPFEKQGENTKLEESFSYRIETNASGAPTRLTIIARARSAEGARRVADLVQREYEDMNRADEKRKKEFARQTLESLLAKSIDEEKKLKLERSDFKKSIGMPFWEDEQRELEERRQLFTAEMNGIKVELIRMNSQFRRIMEIREKARSGQKALSSQNANQDVALLKEFWEIDEIAKYGNLPTLRKHLDELNRERMTFDDNLLKKQEENASIITESDPEIIENARAILRQVQLLKEETTAAVQSLSDRFRQLSADEKEFAGELGELRMKTVQIEKFKEALVSFDRRLETAQKSTDEIRKRLNDLEIEETLSGGKQEGLRKERLAELPRVPIETEPLPSVEKTLLSKNLSFPQTPWIPNGSFTEFHKNGKKKTEGTFGKGKKSGIWVSYDSGGKETGRESFGVD